MYLLTVGILWTPCQPRNGKKKTKGIIFLKTVGFSTDQHWGRKRGFDTRRGLFTNDRVKKKRKGSGHHDWARITGEGFVKSRIDL